MAARRTVTQIDVARIIGALAVVMIHVTAPAVLAFGAIGMKSWWLANLLDSASRWSVPLFVMISGALLLDPKVPRPLPQFLQRRVSKIILPLVFWSGLYFFWLSWWDRVPVDLLYVERGFLVGIPYTHLYFLFLIFGLYLITPMLRIYVMHASRRNAYYCLLVIFGLSALNGYINTFWELGGGLNMTSQFVPFIGYYLAGYYLKDVVLFRRGRQLAVGGVVALTLGMAVMTYLLVRQYGVSMGLYLYKYESVTVIPIALLLYVWLNSALARVSEWRLVKWAPQVFRVMSAATFGIYLIHPLVIDLLNTLGIGATRVHPAVGIPATYLLTLVGSIVIIVSLQQIPGLRRLVP